MEKVHLYYFPYAGASSVTYKSWFKGSDLIEFVVMDYPGHGKRNQEPLIHSANEICDDLFKKIKSRQTNGAPYFFAGHCLGALISYEICRLIERDGTIQPPQRLFLSGHGAPDKLINEGLYKMTDDDLIQYQRKVKGIPEELLGDDFIDYVKEIVLPPIRSDSEVYESYRIGDNDDIIHVPLTVINGLKDWKSPQDEVKRWNEFTSNCVDYINFDDTHYFINNRTDEYLMEIEKGILQNIKSE